MGLFFADDIIKPVISGADYLSDDGLETAVIISLFTDRRVPAAESPSDTGERRGWWGDLFPDVEGDQIGSKLWLSERSKMLNATLSKIETDASDSLQWMIDDSAAKDISVNASFVDGSNDTIAIEIEITRPDKDKDTFAFHWNAQDIKRA